MFLSFRRNVNTAATAIPNGFLDGFKSLIDENTYVVGSAKAVRCLSVFSHDKWQENRVTLIDYIDDKIKFLVGWFETALIRYTFSYKMYSWVVLFSGGQVVVGKLKAVQMATDFPI